MTSRSSNDPMASLRRWAIIPLVVAEVLLVVCVVGGVTAIRDRQTLQSRHSRASVGPDDPVVAKLLTENLGRPPTEEEMAEIRQGWYDTERYPRRSSD